MQIPFNDLKLNYASIKDEIDKAILDVLASQRFIGGPELAAFEKEFAAYCGVGESMACSSGTDALFLALKALGIGPGDDVIVPSMTFAATAEAICAAGARPVFADVEEGRATISVDTLAARVTPATRAVIAVHLYGQLAELDPIAEFCQSNKLKLVEDAAQAHGAELNGKRVGSWGDFTAFSFFPGKNLGAFGDAGGLIGRDPELLRLAKMLSDHGRKDKYLHHLKGYNCRCDALQAAILRVKLRHLPEWTERRRKIADTYLSSLQPNGRYRLPMVAKGSCPVWHLFTIRCEEREALQEHLKAEGISSGVHYPHPLHMQPAFAEDHDGSDLPVSTRIAAETLSLPIFPEMTKEQQDHVISALT